MMTKKIRLKEVSAGLTHTRQLVSNEPCVVMTNEVDINFPLEAIQLIDGKYIIEIEGNDEMNYWFNQKGKGRIPLHHIKIRGEVVEVEEIDEPIDGGLVDIQDWKDEYLTLTGEQKPKRHTKKNKKHE